MKKESNLDIFINASSLHTDIHGNANIHFIFIIIFKLSTVKTLVYKREVIPFFFLLQRVAQNIKHFRRLKQGKPTVPYRQSNKQEKFRGGHEPSTHCAIVVHVCVTQRYYSCKKTSKITLYHCFLDFWRAICEIQNDPALCKYHCTIHLDDDSCHTTQGIGFGVQKKPTKRRWKQITNEPHKKGTKTVQHHQCVKTFLFLKRIHDAAHEIVVGISAFHCSVSVYSKIAK